MEFETKTDTVAMEKSQLDSARSHQSLDLQVRFMVQIGAFKDPQYASTVQTTARARYHIPALNDYNTALALYQIRIGFFETKADAYAFRQRMLREYPNDYKDAWVVQLKR
jgi:cell division protein FtsN